MKMKCIKCGAELPKEAKFCSSCGAEVSQNSDYENDDNCIQTINTEDKKVSFKDKIKLKFCSLWGSLNLFYKISIIAILVLVPLFLIAYFTSTTFAIICTIVQFLGIVIAILFHKGVLYTDKKWLSYLLLIVAIFLTVLNVYSYFWNGKAIDSSKDNSSISSYDNTAPESKTAFLPFDDKECAEKKKDDIVKLLNKEGFYNISTTPISKLEVDEIARKGDIDKITVDGKETFSKGTELPKNVDIEITYYDAKCIAIPISSKDAEIKDTDELVNIFKNGGFLNISVEIENDIDPEYSKETLRNEVSINYDSSFDTNDSFPFDAKVTITSHRPMEKYKVKINVDFISNLLFNKYSVDVELSYRELGTLSHGEDDSYEMWLKPGKHTITFTKHSYIKPEKKVEFTIQGETEITYQITCNEDSIHVEQTEFVDMGAAGDGEAMMPASSSDFKYDNYKDVEKVLKNSGFTNIKTAILYDIVWGWTSEGEVDSVSVNGNKSFSKGSVFKKDAEIVITYHMWEEDDPNKKTDSETSKPSSTTQNNPVDKVPNITIDNNSDFAKLMKITDQTDAKTISAFANSNKGKIVEFDGCVAFMMQHGNYKTRFDVCLASGDYKGRVYGPLFSFEDVNFYEMKVSGTDTVAEGMLFRIAGEIKGYNADGGYIILEPVFMKSR